MLLLAKKASTGIEVGVLCCCQCYFVNTPNTCHAARLFLVANWRLWLWSWRCGSHFLSLKQLRERNEIYRNTEEKCEPHSFKVQLLQPSMCCSSKGGNFGLAAYPNLENLPRLHLNRLRHIREARGCETIVHLYSIFYNYCLSTPLPKSRCRAVLGKKHVQ